VDSLTPRLCFCLPVKALIRLFPEQRKLAFLDSQHHEGRQVQTVVASGEKLKIHAVPTTPFSPSMASPDSFLVRTVAFSIAFGEDQHRVIGVPAKGARVLLEFRLILLL